MKATSKRSAAHGFKTAQNNQIRQAVGYVRVSTDMQAVDGLSLDAQQTAIKHYCELHGLKLVKVCKDVISGAKGQRPGLQEALDTLERGADVLVVLKFDRLSRSIKHFCELYERYFRDGAKELVAIRESIRLDSSLGRALVNILLVFAQMEREATGERTRETITHIRAQGYHFGKVPYGQRSVPAPDNPRMRVLVEDPEEQAVLAQLRAWAAEDIGITEMAARLNAAGIKPPQGPQWTKSTIYNLKLRLNWQKPRPHNERHHTDQELKEHILELRGRGYTSQKIAAILNEQKWVPLKGHRFTERSVRGLLANCKNAKHLTPKRFLETLLDLQAREHAHQQPDVPFQRPGFPRLAKLLEEEGYLTPKGRKNWWPAQVQHLLEGRYETYYSRSAATSASE